MDPVALAYENPKGKLLEFCAKARCMPPRLEVVAVGDRRGASLTLALDGRTLESGMHWALDRLIAEQLAARALLAELAASEEHGEGDEWVTPADAELHRRENPKGKLLERLTLERLHPTFEVRPLVTERGPAFEATAFVERAHGEEIWSDVRRSPVQKIAEQAAAASLLAKLPTLMPSKKTKPVKGQPDPRVVLNNLRLDGKIQDYGFVIERTEGPQHAVRFMMSGFAVRQDGQRIAIDAIAAPSKKEGEKALASALITALDGLP